MAKNIYNKIKRSIPVACGLALVVGLTGCEFEQVKRSSTREEFNNHIGSVTLVQAVEEDKNELNVMNSLGLYIRDIDGDGQADALTVGHDVYWVAEGYQGSEGMYRLSKENPFYTKNAKIMTPEIRSAATRALRGDQDLAYLISERNYELEQGGNQ